jgi:hypothetical protein
MAIAALGGDGVELAHSNEHFRCGLDYFLFSFLLLFISVVYLLIIKKNTSIPTPLCDFCPEVETELASHHSAGRMCMCMAVSSPLFDTSENYLLMTNLMKPVGGIFESKWSKE